MWSNNSLKKMTNIKVNRAEILPTLLYISETWVTDRSHIRLLERFHQRCLRTILNIHWSDHVTNNLVLEQATILSIEAKPLMYHLHWAGHVSRMEDLRLASISLYGELFAGYREKSPKRRRKVCPKKSHTSCWPSMLVRP